MPLATTRRPWIPATLLLASALACGNATDTTPEATSTGDTGAGSTQTSGSTEATTGESPTSSATTEAVGSSSGTTGAPDPGSTGTTGAVADTETTSTTTGTDASTGEPGGTGSSSTGTDTIGESNTSDTGESTGTTGDPDGLGMISGECGLIDAMELESPAPFVFTSAIDFGNIGYDYDLLTLGGQQIADEGGLNDGSLKSEIVAYEVLARCDMAVLLKTEGKIVYQNPMGKKTDLLVDFDGLKIGVSVVRAVGFPKDAAYTVAQAETILKKKLADIQVSSVNVAPEDAWVKQILSVVAYAPMHVDSILTAYEGLDPMLKADTILVVSVSNGDDAFIYE